jgi:hypothetical protein
MIFRTVVAGSGPSNPDATNSAIDWFRFWLAGDASRCCAHDSTYVSRRSGVSPIARTTVDIPSAKIGSAMYLLTNSAGTSTSGSFPKLSQTRAASRSSSGAQSGCGKTARTIANTADC